VFDAVIPWNSPSSDADSFSISQVTPAFYGTVISPHNPSNLFKIYVFIYLNKRINT
jgi:hypothetical protein